MKKFTALWIFILTLFASAQANLMPNSFTITGEWLYFLIGMDYPFIGTETPTGAQNYDGRRLTNNSRWHSGGRIEIQYGLCDCQSRVRLRTTFFPCVRDSRTVTGLLTSEHAGAQFSSEVSGNFHSNFFNLELLYDHSICGCDPFFFSVQAGLQYLHLHLRNKYSILTVDGNFADDRFVSTRNGVGPEIGAELGYLLCPPLSLQMRVLGALIVARKTSKWTEVSATSSFLTKDDPFWTIIPAANLRLGLNYCYLFNLCCSCLNLNLQAGYEVFFYFHPFGQFYAFDNREFFFNYIAHGPYLQLGASF